jgi:transcriptional regulator with XRE-family HTH domain
MVNRSPNLTLRELMKARRLSQEKLAEEVCLAATKLSGETITCSARTVGRWVSGAVKWPWDRYRRPLEVVFGLAITDLGFVPPPGYDDAMVRGISLNSPLEPPVLRRTFILGLGTVLALPVLPTRGRLGLGDIDAVQAASARLHTLDDRHGGAELAEVAARYVEHIEKSARSCSYGMAVQKALHTAIGDLAASAGWFAFDGGRQEAARLWWDRALRYAVLAGDPALQARIWSYMARQSCELGHGGEAVAIARVALDATRHRRDPRLSALLHSRVALGHSLTGEAGRAGQSLHRADRLLDAFDRADSEPWLMFMGPAEITGQAALVEYNLGAYGAAVERDEVALGMLSEGFARNGFAAQVSLARNRLAAGDADAAITAGHRALDVMGGDGVNSPRWGRHLARFVHDAQQGAPAGAAQFAERYREVAAP